MTELKLGRRTIGPASSPYVIAEIGVNHGGSIELAKQLIESAARGGADAAKFQTYKAEKLVIRDSPAYWDTSLEPTATQFELFSRLDAFGPRDYEVLADHCQHVGIDFLSTPFDLEAVDFLDPLMPFFKVASADLTNVPLLRRIGGKRKPVVLSTGASTVEEVRSAVRTLVESGAHAVSLLHCVLSYPTLRHHANLRFISHLRSEFPELVIGYSDHTLPEGDLESLLVAWLLGAQVLEKHFTHDKRLTGNDHYHAMDENDLARFRSVQLHVQELLGDSSTRYVLDVEQIPRTEARRSLVAATDLDEGAVMREENFVAKRPGTGLGPELLDSLVGKRLLRKLVCDEQFRLEDLESE